MDSTTWFLIFFFMMVFMGIFGYIGYGAYVMNSEGRLRKKVNKKKDKVKPGQGSIYD